MTSNLLILHGALGSSRQFDRLSEHLKSDYKVHTMNFEGHGGRSIDGAYRMDSFVSDVQDYITRNELSGIDIFGYSMGGYVALKLASMQPELGGRIMTLGTKLDWSPEVAAREVKMLDPEKIEEKVPKFAAHLDRLHSPLEWKEVVRGTADMMLDLGNNSRLTESEFKAIQNKVLICVGDLDNMVSVNESTAVADLLPYGRLHVAEGFEHPIDKVDAGRLGELIATFFTPVP